MKILFLCVANSARSQMAEGLAKKLLGSKADIQSAGSEPSGKVHPDAIKVMSEIDLDISHHSSKSIDDLPSDFVKELDYAITLCGEEVCPVLHSKSAKLHWGYPDPAGVAENERLDSFRNIRDQLKTRLESWVKTIS